MIPYFCDYFLACSKKAAKWMYPPKIINNKNCIICKNAIDVEKFRFNKTKRFELRKGYNISNDCIVIGHVAGFVYQKNHSFVIKILKSLQKTNLKFKIFFVGIGEELEKIKINVNEFNLSNNVVFLNQRNDVQDLMQLFDILILPSHFEGFGFVVIEAQCSGLPCLVSNGVPQEVKVTDLVHFLSLKDPEEWSRYIIKYGCLNRSDRSKDVAKAGFDIKENIKKIEKLYIDIVNCN